ncbi:MAG: ornithine cyclodeaminase family protein [Nitrososphaerales archaeon]
MVLILSNKDLQKILEMSDVIRVVEMAFKEMGLGNVQLPLRAVILLSEYNGWMGVMPSYVKGMNALATKVVTLYPNNPINLNLPTIMATIILNDPKSGAVLSIMDGTFITAMRTGAASGVAAKYLAREDSEVLGIFGAGIQARTQLMAICEVRDIKKVYIYDIIKEKADKFAEEISKKFGIKVKSVSNPKEAVKSCDIIITATTSTTPVFKGEWLQLGTHITSIGVSTQKDARELDTLTIVKSKVIVDSKEAALQEVGDIKIPILKGVINENHIYAELGEIIAGKKKGRENRDEITLFKSCGLAIQDAVTAYLAYEKAKSAGIGIEIEL